MTTACPSVIRRWRGDEKGGLVSSPRQSGPSSALDSVVRRLGLNVGAYRGETIDIESVLAGIAARATASGWEENSMRTEEGLALPAWVRRREAPVRRIYVSAGIHGDEPAGPLAVLRLM